METSAELLYLLKLDARGIFGFDDPLQQSELQQWLFFWHGSGAPYQGNLGFFRRADEQSHCKPSSTFSTRRAISPPSTNIALLQ